MAFLFGSGLSQARFEELEKLVIRREELLYQVQVGNVVRAIQIFGEDTGTQFKEAKAAVALLEKRLRTRPALTPEEMAKSPFAVRNLLIKGNTAEAVKLYCQQHAVEQTEAREAIEHITMEILRDPNHLRPLIRAGNTTQAARSYSETTGVGLTEAQEVVAQLAKQIQDGR